MTYNGRLVKPERRKGLIRVTKDFQGMVQFQWCDADTKNPIDSLYVFPGDAKFEKVKQSKDRVYILDLNATRRPPIIFAIKLFRLFLFLIVHLFQSLQVR